MSKPEQKRPRCVLFNNACNIDAFYDQIKNNTMNPRDELVW